MRRACTLSYLLSFARSRLTTVRLASEDRKRKIRDAEEITSIKKEKGKREMTVQSGMLTLLFVYRKLQFDFFTSYTRARFYCRGVACTVVVKAFSSIELRRVGRGGGERKIRQKTEICTLLKGEKKN